MNIRLRILFCITWGFSLTLSAQTIKFSPTVIDISGNEIINPGRGFFRWNGEEEAPYKSIDRYQRYRWSDIETSKGVYNFSVLEAEAEKARTDPDGKGTFSFGVRCLVEGTDRSYPSYLDSYMTSWYSPLKSCWVPDWNDTDFLVRVDSLMANLGRKFNNDPRIGYIEIRTYGNWGEWHMSDFETGPPTRPSTITDITQTSINSIINSHVKAFPDKQIIMMTDNNKGLNYAMNLTGLKYPIGWRRDSWCYDPTFSIIKTRSAWTSGGASTRWQTAPVIIEGYQGPKMNYASGLPEVIEYHISAIGNGNINDWTTMRKTAQDSILLCVKTAGYRNILRSLTYPDTILPGQTALFKAEWSNVGVAPVYRDWEIKYRIYNSTSGAIIWEGISKLNLRTLLPTLNRTTLIDTPVFVDDSFNIPRGLAAGNYSLEVIIIDPTTYYNPLKLAILGQKSNGAYSLGTIRISTTTGIETKENSEQEISIHSVLRSGVNLNISKAGLYSIKIYSTDGKCLLSSNNINLNQGIQTFETKNLSKGVYILNVFTENKSKTLRFIQQ